MAQFITPQKPLGLGIIAPAGTGDANALALTNNLAGLTPSPSGNVVITDNLSCSRLEVKANINNQGRIFVCWGIPPYNEGTTFVNISGGELIGGVIRAIDPGESWDFSEGGDVYRPGDYFIVIENAGDNCHAVCDPI
jgi:hypothetical protein